MKIKDCKSINEIPQQELLKYIFINQLHIMRKIENLEHRIHQKEFPDSEIEAIELSINNNLRKIKSLEDRINETLSGQNQ